VSGEPYGVIPGGVRLAVRLSPRGSRDAAEGCGMGADGKPFLRIRLAAPPVDGAANMALIAFLAERLDLRKADISIRSGQTARLKVLHLSGDGAALMAKLAALCG
jgi:uncharacterized protein YggU (UPF0235/DUF167 family)